MNLTIKKSILKGNVNIIPSKSYAHRFIIASFLSRKNCVIKNIPLSDDIFTTLNAIRSLGGNYKIINNDCYISFINLINNSIKISDSASTLRFMIPISLALNNDSSFIVSERLLERGINEYINIFKSKNIKTIINGTNICFNGRLKPGIYNVDGSISSQYITGLLLALPILDGDSEIRINPPISSKSYIDITLDVLDKFNIQYKKEDNCINLKGNQEYNCGDCLVEGDYSNASFIDAFNYFNSNVVINGLNNDSKQGDKVYFNMLKSGYSVIDIDNSIDLAPILFVFAGLNHGAKFTNTDRLKIKESNRIDSMKEELSKVNIKLEVGNNFVIVNQITDKPKNVCFNSHNDHRIAMALSLFSTITNIKIEGYECVNKSYPDYFKVLESLGAKIDYE